MTRTGVSHTDTASGKGHGQLTENPGAPARKGKPHTKADELAALQNQVQAKEAAKGTKSAKPPKG